MSEAKGTRTVLSILREDAEAWWYHQDLRQRGLVKKAAEKERASVRDNVSRLRTTRANGGFCIVGRTAGWTLQVYHRSGGSCKLQGYGGVEAAMPQACLQVGIPVVDLSTVPAKYTSPLLRSPIPVPDGAEDPAPWTGLSYAPFSVCAALYELLGARLYNCKPDASRLKDVKGMTESEDRLFGAFVRGDELALFRAMLERKE